MNASIEWITGAHRLGELEAPWDELVGDHAAPFDQHSWFAAWWSAFGHDGALRLCAAWRGDRLVGVLPFERRGRRGLAALANTHTPFFRPVATDARARYALVEAALSNAGAGLEISAIAYDDPGLAALRQRAQAARRRQVIEPAQVSPIVEIGSDFDAWRNASKPRWGAPLERFRRKMGRDHEAHVTIVEAPTDLERDLTRGFAVEASGWKGSQGTAITSSPATEAFYRQIAHAFHERGQLRLSSVELDGRLAAFDLTLLASNRLYLLKTGFDEAFRKLAPGLVMRLSIIERCFELGLDAHELLGGDSEWKRKFSTTQRAHATFRAYPAGVAGMSRYGYRTMARPLLKRARDAVRTRRGAERPPA